MKPFFIIGNKRSGSTLLVRLLNFHPDIFISHEADTTWILYQFFNNKPFEPYPLDDPVGMEYTLKHCKDLLDKSLSPEINFFAVQKYLMKNGNPWVEACQKTPLWLGDKKPFQNADPKLLEFTIKHFPDVKFIHLYRHPFNVALSSKRFRGDGGMLWSAISIDEVVQRWYHYEQNALEVSKQYPDKVLTVRYETLCKKTKHEMKRVFDFLHVRTDADVLKKCNAHAVYKIRPTPHIRCNQDVASLMNKYGYHPKKVSIPRWAIRPINALLVGLNWIKSFI